MDAAEAGGLNWGSLAADVPLAEVLSRHHWAAGTLRPGPVAPLSNDRIARRVVAAGSLEDGRPVHLLVRSIGHGPPVVLLHPSPRSASHLGPMMRAWADRRTLITVDNPGQGYSDHPDRPEIACYTDLLSSLLSQLDLVGVDVWGTHTGAKIALDLAVRYPDHVQRLVLDGIGMYSAEQIEEFWTDYIRPMVADMHGTHLLEAWHERRDMYLFYPWYQQTADSARTTHPRDVRELPLAFDCELEAFVVSGALTANGRELAAVTYFRVDPGVGARDVDCPSVSRLLLWYRGAARVASALPAPAGDLVVKRVDDMLEAGDYDLVPAEEQIKIKQLRLRRFPEGGSCTDVGVVTEGFRRTDLAVHESDEEVLVLQGWVATDRDNVYRPGDYLCWPAGWIHGPVQGYGAIYVEKHHGVKSAKVVPAYTKGIDIGR
ncbi:alpha/beta fold hydrolase [Dactylosporangium roseum]|uniref:Alpha/beta fold hydrolase n=1 Tax=Dactylosporangium roseum TaxID=47989 RepID=A0ABY5Z162_9ACTN|nr:alpha/beta fold hydrolase [Dactylosporangium roseum]UWZ34229.1 alpha/beta fold hydrolase [Dactylosporangium roseum]